MQQIHHLVDTFILSGFGQITIFTTAIKTKKHQPKVVRLESKAIQIPEQLKSAYCRTLEVQSCNIKDLLRPLCKSDSSKNAALYLGYIQGIFDSKMTLTDYRGFLHVALLILESCYYALSRRPGIWPKRSSSITVWCAASLPWASLTIRRY